MFQRIGLAPSCGLALTLLALAPAGLAEPAEEPLTFFNRTIGLTAQQVAAIADGRAVAKVLPWGGRSEIFVFGAVRVQGSLERFLTESRSVDRLATLPGYLGAGEISAEVTPSDVQAITLDPDDIIALKNCRPEDCDVQLPTESMQAFHDAVTRTDPDAPERANHLARAMVAALLTQYQRGGNAALGTYRDKKKPSRVAEQFETMLARSRALPEYLPELHRYLLEYPAVGLPGAESFFYWEKVEFGLKPTLRVNHGVIYRTKGPNGPIGAVAIKQLYASHYFHTALDLSVCVTDTTRSDRRGFYLITLKASEQDGLTGFKGSLLRKIIVDRTRSSLERALASIKQTVERDARP